ncbi:hypothetical protein Vau01_005510 [Virgisporangium aurantiacum]|uniref:Putative restriction endonuclease domain-containing protein n=2 Tax=Virgisporangium aurantiacum TaxID=175570 RepID=A0A8J4DW32_9ACTN|nr:hypothetical protein Vau01_005510 [Virgisporangium aurantiacum]
MPARFGLDDLAAMNAFDAFGHRYETSSEGMLSVMPPPDSEHAVIATRLTIWLAMAGWTAEQIMQAAGIRIPGEDGDSGRIPDLTVWSKPQPPSVWLPITDLLLVIEIVSVGSRSTDKDTKRYEYASAGIPQYWVVDRDNAQTVTLHRLGPDDTYVERAKMPLAWLLRTEPSEHLG